MRFALNQKNIRKNRGGGLVELCAALVVGIPIFLASMDLGIIALGAYTNDCVCRDAARAAASGAPASATAPVSHQVSANEAPYDRAVAVIEDHLPTALPIKVSDSPQVSETLNYVPTPDVGGSVDGSVSVKTSAFIFPPFILSAYYGHAGLTLTSMHTDSYTYVVNTKPAAP